MHQPCAATPSAFHFLLGQRWGSAATQCLPQPAANGRPGATAAGRSCGRARLPSALLGAGHVQMDTQRGSAQRKTLCVTGERRESKAGVIYRGCARSGHDTEPFCALKRKQKFLLFLKQQ